MKCLNPSCEEPAKHRGLCHNCYQAARKLIKEGKTTWGQLIANGKCTESMHEHGGKKAKWFLS